MTAADNSNVVDEVEIGVRRPDEAAPIDVALRALRRQRTECFRLLATHPDADATDRLLDELSRLGDLETCWLEVAGTDPM